MYSPADHDYLQGMDASLSLLWKIRRLTHGTLVPPILKPRGQTGGMEGMVAAAQHQDTAMAERLVAVALASLDGWGWLSAGTAVEGYQSRIGTG